MHLYELGTARIALEAMIAENDGELTPDLEAAWEQSGADIRQKVENTALFIKELEAEADAVMQYAAAITAVAQGHKERAAAAQAHADRLRAYVLEQMERVGMPEVRTMRVWVKPVQSSGSIDHDFDPAIAEIQLRHAFVDDESPLHPYVVEVPATYRLDKKRLQELRKLDCSLPPHVVVNHTTSLRIK